MYFKGKLNGQAKGKSGGPVYAENSYGETPRACAPKNQAGKELEVKKEGMTSALFSHFTDTGKWARRI